MTLRLLTALLVCLATLIGGTATASAQTPLSPVFDALKSPFQKIAGNQGHANFQNNTLSGQDPVGLRWPLAI